MKLQRILLAGLLMGATYVTGCGDDDGDTDAGGTPDAGGEVDTGPAVDTGPTEDAGDGVYPCAYPDAPYGTRAGRMFEPFTLNTCDGTPYEFVNDDFCDPGHTMTVVSIAAGWCPPCIAESEQLTEEITERYRAQGVRVIQILTQTEDFNAPDGAWCQAWVDRFELTNVQVIDPDQITGIYFPDGVLPSTIIVDNNGMIRFRENGATEGLISLRAAIEDVLENP